jgi:hypothetical protein
MTYPLNVETALTALTIKSIRPLYAAIIIEGAFPAGVPAELAPVVKACREATTSWAGVDAALRALDGKVAA